MDYSDSNRYNTIGGPNFPSEEEQQIYFDTMQEFNQLQLWRAVHAGQWEEAAALIWPPARNTFFYGTFNWPGMKKTELQIDATGMLALQRFGAICDSLLTPSGSEYERLRASDPYVMKDRQSRLWFDRASAILYQQRSNPYSNFASQNQNLFISLGAFGTGVMNIEEFYDEGEGHRGLRYINVPLGEFFGHQNWQGVSDGFIRWYRMTARQAYQKFYKDDPNMIPAVLKTALDTHSEWPYNFLHRVGPRLDYDPERVDAKGKPYFSYHISIEGHCLCCPAGGYRRLPVIPSRYMQTPGEYYGRGPCQFVLPALKTLNAEKRTFLKAGHRAADPVLLTPDDGLIGLSLLPGAMNKGGMSSDGKPLIGTLPIGNIQITKEMMAEERQLINDSFLVSLFQILTETPQMSATEVIERVNEKGILIAPTLGRQESEYRGPSIDRELDCLAHLQLLPPMPPRLREAKGSYEVIYDNPMTRMRKAQKVSSFFRSVEQTKELVQVTGDTSLLHPYDFKVAIPEIAYIEGVPERWMSSSEDIAKKDKQLADAQAKQQQIQAMPSQAAMMKAQAVQAKAGMQQPQQQQQAPPDQQQQMQQGGLQQ